MFWDYILVFGRWANLPRFWRILSVFFSLSWVWNCFQVSESSWLQCAKLWFQSFGIGEMHLKLLLFRKCINICDKYMEIVWVHFQMICMLHMCCDQEFAENWLNILGGFKAPLGFCLLLQISAGKLQSFVVLWKKNKQQHDMWSLSLPRNSSFMWLKRKLAPEEFIDVIATQVRHPGYMNWHKCLWVTTEAAFEFLNFFRKPK